MSEPKIRWEPTILGCFDGYTPGEIHAVVRYLIMMRPSGKYWLFAWAARKEFPWRSNSSTIKTFDDLEEAKAHAEQLEANK
jgi:hypothetical protein